MKKNGVIAWGLLQIEHILLKINESKALNWDMMYRKETEETILKLTDFERQYHKIIPGDEYIYIREVDTDDLLYAVNVTGDSALTALSELMKLLADKF